jgi:hypothetical protein
MGYQPSVMIAGRVPLEGVLRALAEERPVFHSEADFHQAFAWAVRTLDPSLRVRLETRPVPGVRLDLLVSTLDGTAQSAIELKYVTRAWTGDVLGERFELKAQGAQDIRAYDVVKDIARVESIASLVPGCNGAVVCLANDASYWRTPTALRDTNASAFRLYEGAVVDGTRTWGLNTGAGTKRGREAALVLRHRHTMAWRDYSTVPGTAGIFRALVVEVPAA